MAKVYLKFNSAVIKEIFLTKEETTFGRKPTNDIVIDHPTISGFHGKIKKEADHFVVEDLNSTNGTFINGRRTTSGVLKDKDQIGVAGHILAFHSDDAAVEAPPPAPAPHVAPDADGQKEMLKKSLGMGAKNGSASDAPAAEKNEKEPEPIVGTIRVIAGNVNGQTDVEIKDLVTYIGTAAHALIKIKGFMAPDLAAAISKRPEGFFLKAVKSGYPKVNGHAVQESIFLENGALIEIGGTNMVFYRSDAKKVSSAPVSNA